MEATAVRKSILKKIPDGSVITRHNEKGHFYEIVPLGGVVYPSVTAKLQILKDPGLMNWKMNEALKYIFQNYQKFTDDNILEHISNAKRSPQDIFEDAGDIGTRIHNYRENYFKKWIRSGIKPGLGADFIPEVEKDVRAISAMRGLDKFVDDWRYEPVVSELYVWSEQFEIAGTLDDIGIIQKDRKKKLVLLDLKSSNQFKDHYFFQVAMYLMMFVKITGIVPEVSLILKVSKTDGTYSIEEMRNTRRLISFAKAVLRVNDGLEFIGEMRKDNQKKVLKI